jgi:hypothetical protein
MLNQLKDSNTTDFRVVKRLSMILKNICTTTNPEDVQKVFYFYFLFLFNYIFFYMFYSLIQIINTNIFTFYADVITLLLSPPSEGLENADEVISRFPSDYLLVIEDIVQSIHFLLADEKEVVDSLLKEGQRLVPILLLLLQSATMLILNPAASPNDMANTLLSTFKVWSWLFMNK